jgi:hypothetical protein
LAEDRDNLPAYLPTEYIKSDLLNESRRASDLKAILTIPQGEFSSPALSYEENRVLACCALRCLLNDLNDTIKIAKERLRGANPNFKQVNNEISLAEKALQDICTPTNS